MLSGVERAVLTAVDVAVLRRDVAELVAIPSVGGSSAELDVQRWMADRLAALGADVDAWALDLAVLRADPQYPGEEVPRESALGVVGQLGEGEPGLVLAGHVDVVPASWPDGDPWTLVEREGSLIGRGSCDMKGGMAAVLAAVLALRTAGARLTRPLAVHSVAGEEDGGIGTFGTLARGHRGAACVLAEPTAGTVVPANAGSLTFRLEVHGRATHGGTRTSGVSALDAAAPVLGALRALEAERNREPPPEFAHLDLAAPLSVGRVRAGDWASTVPDLFVAEGRYGVLPGEPLPAAQAAFEQAVAAACDADPWLAEHPALVTWPGGVYAPGALPIGSDLLPQTRAAVADAGGSVPPARGAPYGSDLRLYAAAGVPVLHYGPGDARDAHAVDERVRLDDLLLAARTYALLALRRCCI